MASASFSTVENVKGCLSEVMFNSLKKYISDTSNE